MAPWRAVGMCATVMVAVLLWTVAGSSTLAASLPDGRQYELVSPPDKHGADINADSSRTRAAAEGDAVSFASLGGFADVRGTGVATEYMSERTGTPNPGSNGWTTHAITPRQDPLSLIGGFQALETAWQGEFSSDLNSGVIRAWSPLTTEDPNVTQVINAYVRTDLRTPGAGEYRLVSLCPACSTPLNPLTNLQAGAPPQFTGASADYDHVLFESRIKRTSDATGGAIKLYEWADGTVRLAGILPDTACGTPPCPAAGSTAGGLHAISNDGSRVIFAAGGQVYERTDGTQTVGISASERTPVDPGGSQPAKVWTSSLDGTRVFFTTSEELTDDDTNSVVDLYMWNADASSGHHLTRLSVDNNGGDPPGDVAGVFGASDHGEYVYFAATGQLVAGKPISGSPLIYAWHDGATPTISYVGKMDAGDGPENFAQGSQLAGGVRSRVAPDGRHLLFLSHSGSGLLSAHGGVDYNQQSCGVGCAELYLYSVASDALVCVSCNPTGAPATTDANDVVRSGTGASVNSTHLNHPMSADGQRVFFSTNEPLVARDANGKSDVYEYDVDSGAAHLISSGRDPADAFFLDASTDGIDAFFITRQQLVGWDTDANYDIYDARGGGGFPDPSPLSPTCAGDACQGEMSAVPGSADTGSTRATGDGNVNPTIKHKPKPKPTKCKKGFVRKKVKGKTKCVRKRTATRARRDVSRRVGR